MASLDSNDVNIVRQVLKYMKQLNLKCRLYENVD
jgi:hypothetical protein